MLRLNIYTQKQFAQKGIIFQVSILHNNKIIEEVCMTKLFHRCTTWRYIRIQYSITSQTQVWTNISIDAYKFQYYIYIYIYIYKKLKHISTKLKYLSESLSFISTKLTTPLNSFTDGLILSVSGMKAVGEIITDGLTDGIHPSV